MHRTIRILKKQDVFARISRIDSGHYTHKTPRTRNVKPITVKRIPNGQH